MELPNVSYGIEDSGSASSQGDEDVFYPLFATWLTDVLEETTQAIVLGGDAFKDSWGSPDVVGKAESRRSDIIKSPTSIVSAVMRIDSACLVTSIGRACSNKLFSHKSYLVIARNISREDLDRLYSLCLVFGIGLVTFSKESHTQPDFQLLVHATKHEPVLFYTNEFVAKIEKELFS